MMRNHITLIAKQIEIQLKTLSMIPAAAMGKMPCELLQLLK